MREMVVASAKILPKVDWLKSTLSGHPASDSTRLRRTRVPASRNRPCPRYALVPAWGGKQIHQTLPRMLLVAIPPFTERRPHHDLAER